MREPPQGRPVRAVVCLRVALARRARACGSVLGLPESQMAPARAGVRSLADRCQAGGRRVCAM
jgi:hypothetical protein